MIYVRRFKNGGGEWSRGAQKKAVGCRALETEKEYGRQERHGLEKNGDLKKNCHERRKWD